MTEAFRLTSPDGLYAAEIRPDLGALLTSFRFHQLELIDCALDQPHWEAGFPSALLYPFPNRINLGRYDWQENHYQLTQNETGRHHALHGLIWNQVFQVVSHESDHLICVYTYTGTDPGYPFSFTIEVQFALDATGLRLSYTIENTSDQTVPAAWGWHPYFRLGEEPIDSCQLTLPHHHLIKLGKDMIPVQETSENIAGSTFSLKGIVLDQVYQFTRLEKAIICVQNTAGRLTCSFSEGHPYFTLYTPPSRASIAIEPQTANIDAFNNKQGLWSLYPREQKTGTIHLQYEELTILGEVR